ncbi:MAG: CinA family protein [Chloroflexia bacterium]
MDQMREETLEARLGAYLRRRGWTLAVAESCTGGLLAHRLTNVPGSSDYFLGGVVAYSNAAKQALLGIGAALLEREGAVSEAVAREMASSVRRLFGADIGVGITGIAGPTGGTPEKPVGLVYIALAAGGRVRCERHIWPYDRLGNKEASARRAMEMVLEDLKG